jgi:thymidylate kinase
LQLTDFAKVLVLEGLPCCGKSSLARRVASTFETSSCPEIVTKTRHHLSLGRKGAQDNDHLKYQIICQSAKPILVDRYFYSTIAYEAAALSEPLSADIILRIAAELKVQEFAIEHTVIVWKPDINLSLERIALDKHQSRSSLWSNKLFLERFAQSYLIMFDCAVISLITRYCSDVVWVEDVNAFEMASRNLGVVPPYFDRSSGYP